MNTLVGGCLCGAVRYEVSGGPMTCYSCHCRDCQYITGGQPNSAIYIPQAHLTITNNCEPHSYTSQSDAGTGVTRFFCGKCGTPLYGESEMFEGSIVIKVGSLDDPSVFKPTMNVWVSSAQPWHYIDSDLKSYARKPE